MATLNKVLLMGNLTRDPELRRIGDNNTAVCNLSLAMNRRFTTGSGEDREETCFVDIEVWGRQAENCERYLNKGRLILVEGRLRQDRWEDKETGAARSRLRVRADNVQFLDGGSGRGDRSESGGSAQAGRGEEAGERPSFSESASQATGGGPLNDEGAQDQDVDDVPF